MGVTSPEKISEQFGALFNKRDKAGLLNLYHDDAVFTFDGQAVVSGKPAISEAMQGFFDSPLKIEIICAFCHVSGDIAVVRSDWKLKAPDGSQQSAGSSAEVMRRGGDGLWRFQIDDATYASRPPAI